MTQSGLSGAHILVGSSPPSTTTTYVHRMDHSDIMALRTGETEHFSSTKCALTLSLRSYFAWEAAFNMLLTLCIMVVFALGSYRISKDVHNIIVAPLERMTAVVRKLAGTICFLQSTSPVLSGGNDDDDSSN